MDVCNDGPMGMLSLLKPILKLRPIIMDLDKPGQRGGDLRVLLDTSVDRNGGPLHRVFDFVGPPAHEQAQ